MEKGTPNFGNQRKFWKQGFQILEKRVLEIQVYHLIAVLQKLGADDKFQKILKRFRKGASILEKGEKGGPHFRKF